MRLGVEVSEDRVDLISSVLSFLFCFVLFCFFVLKY